MILIFGILPDQFRHIKSKVGDDVEHLPTEKLVNASPSVERVIINTRFVKHKHVDRIVTRFGKDKCSFVHGGVSSIVREIKRIKDDK